jgi:hypothetical protein
MQNTMRAVAPHMGTTRFIRWKLRSDQIPPSWDDAFAGNPRRSDIRASLGFYNM